LGAKEILSHKKKYFSTASENRLSVLSSLSTRAYLNFQERSARTTTPILAGTCIEETSNQTAISPVSFSLFLSPQQASNSASA
jgi:hypothetical protein